MDIRYAKKGTEMQRTTTLPHDDAATITPEEEGAIPGTPVPDTETYDGNITLQQYMSFINEHGVTKDDVFELLASIITSGNIEWGFKLFDKIDVRFRMRASWVEDCISKMIDKENLGDAKISMIRFSNMIRVCNLAGSLARYGDTVFGMDTEDDFKRNYDFVRRLPYPVLVKLCDNLAVFDRAIAVAMSDWALKNFTTRQQAAV